MHVTIENMGTTSLKGWRFTFTLPGKQQIVGSWNGGFSQSGSRVNIVNAGYNASLAPSSSMTVGFQADTNGSAGGPGGYALNGVPCSG